MDNLKQACARAYNTIMRGYTVSIVQDADGTFRAVRGRARGAIMTWTKRPVIADDAGNVISNHKDDIIQEMVWQVTCKDAGLDTSKQLVKERKHVW